MGHGGGLITMKADKWRVQRKLIDPCFGVKILKSYMPIFNENISIMMDNLEKKVDKGTFNFYESMDACTLDMICRKLDIWWMKREA